MINKLKAKMAEISYKANEGHLGSSFSITDILFEVYSRNIKHNNDLIVLSKGHASLAHAVILAHFNYISWDSLDSYCSFDSILGGHLDARRVNGVSFSTGSLGHGICMALGAAIAKNIKKCDDGVIVIVGDGEANEGSFWESVLFAGSRKISNLTIIIDYNRSNDRSIKLDNLIEKLSSFNFGVVEIDGHSSDQIKNALGHSSAVRTKPFAIIANTTKGKGVSFMENNPAWHHKVPSIDELNQIHRELMQ